MSGEHDTKLNGSMSPILDAFNKADEMTRATDDRTEEQTGPDMSILQMGRREPPVFPLDILGPSWKAWVMDTAQAAACPVDYVVATLLAAASALIGNARWVQPVPGWAEPPHLWCGAVGDSGEGKSPGADVLLGIVLPELESRMAEDHDRNLLQWDAEAAIATAEKKEWENAVSQAAKGKTKMPPPLTGTLRPKPQQPCLIQNDVTIEKVASLLAEAAPKGLLIIRDELSGWLTGLNNYNNAGRPFWIESYGGRPFRVDRQKLDKPVVVDRLVVALSGGTQPEKLAKMFQDADDGLLARIIWFWPNPLEFKLSRAVPDVFFAINALDRLRRLTLRARAQEGAKPEPIKVPLPVDTHEPMEQFAREMQQLQHSTGGLLRSAYGKARGLVARVSLVLEYLWWCGGEADIPEPASISAKAFYAAAYMIADYTMPMATRVYGDAAAAPAARHATTLARYIIKKKLSEVHVRTLQRVDKLPGLKDAQTIHRAIDELIEVGWLVRPAAKGTAGAQRKAYAVNPAVFNNPATIAKRSHSRWALDFHTLERDDKWDKSKSVSNVNDLGKNDAVTNQDTSDKSGHHEDDAVQQDRFVPLVLKCHGGRSEQIAPPGQTENPQDTDNKENSSQVDSGKPDEGRFVPFVTGFQGDENDGPADRALTNRESDNPEVDNQEAPQAATGALPAQRRPLSLEQQIALQRTGQWRRQHAAE